MTARRDDTRLPAVLDLPAPRGARLVARWLLDEAERARARLRVEGDDEALHDFRVTVRRLRSWLRAWRKELRGGKPRSARRRLARIARTTGAQRDAEVHRKWIEKITSELAPRERAGARALAARLGADQDPGDAVLVELDAAWIPLREELLQRWGRYRARMRVDGTTADRVMSAAWAPRIERHARELAEALEGAGDGSEDVPTHAARIAAKRLRYLLEPVAREEAAVEPLIARLREVQDTLGDLHDARLLMIEVDDALHDDDGDDETPAPSPTMSDVVPSPAARTKRSRDPRPGLRAIRAKLCEREEARVGELRAAWLGGRAAPFLAEVAAIAAMLERRAAPSVEIERKYLLRAVPPVAAEAPAEEVVQGYLPGSTLVERLRRVRGPEGERCYRTVKLGLGMARTELEEATDGDVFETMWPLTIGRRVHKRRHRVPDGDVVWEVDDFTDRSLVLAEVELQDESQQVTLPAWLAPYVVREVTGEAAYQNSTLAR